MPARFRLAVAALACLAAPGRAADQGAINTAIASGVSYLKGAALGGGGGEGGGHGVGPAALAGLALLEAEVSANDPSVAALADRVRANAATETGTYQLALSIAFLDRAGNPSDEVNIQLMGVRLYAGLTASGGFGYSCPQLVQGAAAVPPAPKPKTAPKPKGRKPEDDGFPKVKPPPEPTDGPPGSGPAPNTAKLDPRIARLFLAVRQDLAQKGRTGGEGDNSNTQFGIVGLWVASQRGLPCDDAFALIAARFIQSQNPADGGWGYTPGQSASSTAMTCAGLLGIAVAEARFSARKKGKTAQVPGGADPFDAPPAPKQGTIGGTSEPRRVAAVAGFNAVRRMIGNNGPGQVNAGAGNDYYTLWSVERVAVAYSLTTINGFDWYAWGSEYLVKQQSPGGAWQGSSYGAEVNTSFALLFLLKANLVRGLGADVAALSPQELRGGRDFRPGAQPVPERPDITKPPSGAAPPIDPAAQADPAVALAERLLAASKEPGGAFDAHLAELRDSKGASYTTALLLATPRLAGERETAARDALVSRLTRMTARTLKAQVSDPNADLRRAACQAVGQKPEPTLAGDLVVRIADPVDAVVQAARASLKTLSKEDHGPEPGGDAEAKAKAKAAWAKWLAANPTGQKP